MRARVTDSWPSMHLAYALFAKEGEVSRRHESTLDAAYKWEISFSYA